MSFRTAAIGAAWAALVACGFLFFPGHTFLQSDTQIYLPILERLRDASLFTREPVAARPHVAYTIYDEMALLLARLTGQDFQFVLVAQQLVFRYCGLAGAFWIGRGFGLSNVLSLLLASVYGLGATIAGPAVLILEYEPVPRGYAGPLLVLAMGLASQARWMGAGIACAVAMLYHPPTTAPVLAVLGLVVFARRARPLSFGPRLAALVPIAAASVLILVLAGLQNGSEEAHRFLGTIDPELERLQRLRGSYVWITLWGAPWVRHYEFLFAVAMAAYWRLRERVPAGFRWFQAGLPVYGLAMLPLSYLLLEQGKWIFMPQFQPLRAVLFITLMAMLGSMLAGIFAAREGRQLESMAWLVVAFAIPAQADVLQLVIPDFRDATIARRFFVVLGLAVAAHLAARLETSRARLAAVFAVAAMALPFYLMPGPARVRNYPNLDHPEVHDLAAWAHSNTSKDAVFLFPDAGQDLYPGLFRVYAKRALYVDWKGGGQVNLVKDFGGEWWKRWVASGEGKFDAGNAGALAALGIDYIVVKPEHRLASPQTAHENARYLVYRLR